MALRNTRILKEIAILQESKLDGITILPTTNSNVIQAEITGPHGSRFESVKTRLELRLSES